MLKKNIAIAALISLIAISCSSDDPVTDNGENTGENNGGGTGGNPPELSLNEQIERLSKLSYSKLTPSEQKVKFEAEANEMMNQIDKSKTSSATDALENLGILLDKNPVDIFGGKNSNQIEDIINVSGIYGIYTWNNGTQKWIKTNSTTELKFVFPAKDGQTVNNAILSSNSTSSTIKAEITDTRGSWNYDPKTNDFIFTKEVIDQIFLPSTVKSTLSIDNKEIATIEGNSKYEKNEVPTETNLKINFSGGYAYEMSSIKGNPNSAKFVFSNNGKNLIKFTAGATSQIDKLLEDDSVLSYHGKANGLVEIMDNFVILEDINFEGMTKENQELNNKNQYPYFQSSTYYSDLNKFYKAGAEGDAAVANNNIKSILVSKKDGTKIADLVQRAVKGYLDNWSEIRWDEKTKQWMWDPINGNTFLIQYYDTVTYLRFNDNTEVEFSAYFSTGFDNIQTRFRNLLK